MQDVQHGISISVNTMHATVQRYVAGRKRTGRGKQKVVQTDVQRKTDDHLPAVQDDALPTGRQRYSPAQTAAIKNQMISDVVEAQRVMLGRHTTGIDLNDFESVKLVTDEYMKHCADLKITPSIEGLCGCMGLSRPWVYQYLQQHGDTETAKFIDRLRTMWIAGKVALAEKGALDAGMVVFQMKNSSLGYSDAQKMEIIVAQNPDPNANRPQWAYGLSEEEYMKKIVEEMEMLYDGDDE